jgi:acetyl esterase
MDVHVLDERIDGPHGSIPIRRYSPPSGAPSVPRTPTVVWLHGGGFFRGGLDQPESDAVARSLAASGYPVVTVDYRLVPPPFTGWLRWRTPAIRYPIPMDDVIAALQTVSESVGGRVVVGGASAGACLAAGAALRHQDEGGRLAGVILAYGFFHVTQPRSLARNHRPRRHRRLTHSRWGLDVMNRNYLGDRSTVDRYAFPGGGDVTGFPPAIVIQAERDGMRASGDQFAIELESAGSHVERHVIRGSSHAFLNRPRGEHYATGLARMTHWLDGLRADVATADNL